MKILNLYAGIGGNRKLWGDEHEITAVEYKPEIAAIYSDFFPKDKMVIGDAHEYLLKHFAEFDFIWSSPPCPTHSRINRSNSLNPYKDNAKQIAHGGGITIRYPEMGLYQEIIILNEFFRGKWCVENVISYYEPLLKPKEFGSHYFWTNFALPSFEDGKEARGIGTNQVSVGYLAKRFGYDVAKLKNVDKRTVLRNCVVPELGKHILDWSQKEWHHTKTLI